MEQHTSEPQPPAIATIRHDGWTGERIATFCETLAETAVVADACDAAGIGVSGAYAARRRNPVFAAPWDAALSIARERLADTLLARSMEGNVEQIWRDGELVGERRVIDNRLGLAVLRRLDRLAETGMTLHTNPPLPGARAPRKVLLCGDPVGRGPGQRCTAASQRLDPGLRRETIDWNLAVEALRRGDDEGVAKALALIESNEVEEVEDPLNRPPSPEENNIPDLSDRCWRDEEEEMWMTDFPPPAGFSGYESCPYDDIQDDERYERVCTDDEAALLEADAKRARAAEREQHEAQRDSWFASLRGDMEIAG